MSSPLHETAREKSELFAYLYRQWEPIQNSQLLRKWQVMSSPHTKLPEKKASSLHIYTANENPFKTVNL